MYGEMLFILYFSEKCPCGWRVSIIVKAGGINVGNLLVEATFAETNIAVSSSSRSK